jgi:hypothetical protein
VVLDLTNRRISLAADSEACHIEIAADQAAAALIGLAELAQRRAALAGALTDDANEAGRAIARGVAARIALGAGAGREAYRAVVLGTAAVAFRMLDEGVTAHTGGARAGREWIALEVGRRQVGVGATGVDRIGIDRFAATLRGSRAGRATAGPTET